MIRRPDWSSRLEAFTERMRGRPFVWGATDCGSLVRGTLEAVYGVAGLPVYTSLRGAMAVLASASIRTRLGQLGLREQIAVVAPGDIIVWPWTAADELAECAIAVAGGILTADRIAGIQVLPSPADPLPVWRAA